MKRIFACVILLMALMANAAITDTLRLKTQLVPGQPLNVTVISPEPKAEGQKFPVVYLLNGYSGDNKSWPSIMADYVNDVVDSYGMILVMPDGRDSWYWDSPVKPEMRMESFITTELVPYIDNNYPTIADSAHRAISGLSMGGQGAMWLAMRHSDIFGNAGSTSGGVDIRPFPKKWKMANWLGDKAANPQVWEEHAVINLVPTLAPGQLNIIFDCGVDDFFAEVNSNLHDSLLAAGIPHDYISRPGNHTRDYWRNSILYHLLFFDQNFKKASAN